MRILIGVNYEIQENYDLHMFDRYGVNHIEWMREHNFQQHRNLPRKIFLGGVLRG